MKMINKNFSLSVAYLIMISSLIIFNVPKVEATTWVEGHITSDTTWTVENSPYVVTNDVTVDTEVTLAIEPGVEVKFGGYFSIIVEGSLSAIGTNSQNIVFTSNKLSPVKGDWNTIKANCAGNQTMAKFEMYYCEVSYAADGVTIDTTEETFIEESYLYNNLNSGICVVGKSNCLLKENTIKFNKYGLTSRGEQLSGLTIENNLISDNSEDSIYLYVHKNTDHPHIYDVYISGNTITSNGHGVFLFSDGSYGLGSANGYIHDISISENSIDADNNGIYFLGEGYGGYVYNISISSNSIVAGDNGIYQYGYGVDGGNSCVNDVIVSGNTIECNGHGIYLLGYNYWNGKGYVYNVEISGNIIDSGSEGIHLHSEGTWNWYCYSYVYDILISDNSITSNNNGIYLHGGDKDDNRIYDVSVSENSIDAGGNGIYLCGGEAGYIYNVSLSQNTVVWNSNLLI